MHCKPYGMSKFLQMIHAHPPAQDLLISFPTNLMKKPSSYTWPITLIGLQHSCSPYSINCDRKLNTVNYPSVLNITWFHMQKLKELNLSSSLNLNFHYTIFQQVQSRAQKIRLSQQNYVLFVSTFKNCRDCAFTHSDPHNICRISPVDHT